MRQIVVVLIVLMSVVSCSTRKDRAVNRAYHQTTTKFNVLFNGQEAIAAGIEAELASHQPNFWEQLPLDPFPLVDLFTLNPKENANFSRGEEKAVIAVQKHSMQFGNEQRNQQIDESYLLLGKARYYNGRYLQALDAFNYIIEQLPNTSSINEAQLWKAKVLIQLLQEQRAIAIFEELLSTAELSQSESADASAYLAKALLALNQPQKATQPLSNAAALTKDKTLRARYYYLLGQLYDQLQHKDSAAVAYQNIIDFNRRIPRTYWIHAKLNQLNTSQLAEEAVQKQYSKLTKNEENKRYLDKIHLSHAFYSLSINDTLATKGLINASLRTNTKDNILKGLAYETMGNVLFEQNEFVLSGAYLDSTLQVLTPNTRAFRKIKRKRDKLNDIINYETTRETADSLLTLMEKTPEEQKLVFEDYIKALKKADSLQLVKQESQQQLASNNSFFVGDFYFYNLSMRARGESEFYRIWGNIKKTDNWRYSSLQSVELAAADVVEEPTEEEEPPDPRYVVETYTTQILPLEKRDSLTQVRNTAYFEAGLAYKEQFEVYPKAKDRLLTLLSLNTRYNLPSLYHLYQIEIETEGDQAEAYKNRIITEYPDSQYAMILQNPEAMEDALTLFEGRYTFLSERFKSQAFEEVIDGCFTAILSLQDESLRSRFALLRAHAIGRLDGVEAYQTALSEVALSFPNQTAGKEANKRLKQIKEITPSNAKEGNRFLVYFVFDRDDNETTKTIQNKLTNTISNQGLQQSVSVTIDVFDRKTELLVVQRFTSKEQAIDYRDNLLRIHPELRKIKNFVDLTSGLRDVLIFKNLTVQ
ncbi:MAG: tetratricopeptide repeat protein [Bacteroidota bacterium]|nr:tetratricopeptide repeat protein [Bacteroidota bacterium]